MSDLRDELPILRAASAEASAHPGAAVPELSVGQLLQQARQARALSLQDLSDRLKVPVKRLEALEADQFETGPALQVGRAMVASLARQLGLNPQELLAKMPQAATVSIVPAPHEGSGSYRPSASAGSRSSRLQSMPRIWWLTGIFLVLAGFVFLLPYAEQWFTSVRSAPDATVLPSVPVQGAASVAGPAAPAPAAPVPATSAATAEPIQPSVAAPASASASAAPMRQASAPAVAASAPTALPLIAFKAHGPTWVEVVDANGQVLLRRTLTNAETVQTGGTLPLSVVVGRADHTEVTVRSMPYPLDTVTTENVARFKVQ